MTETVSGTTSITTSSAHPEQNIKFKVDLPRLRDAWRAVSGLSHDGSFTLIVSDSEVRLEASGDFSVEGIVPISEASGFNTGTALHLNVAEQSFAALGVGELPQFGNLVLDRLVAEEGYTGTLRLEADFTVQLPYTVTGVGIDAVTLEPAAGTPVDPRTIRSAISEIRDFAGSNDIKGYSLGTLQILNQEALGMSITACNAIQTDRFKAINLHFPASCAKGLSALLGQLQPADTSLTTTDTHHILFDRRLRVTLPIAETLREWPEPKLPVTQIQLDAADFKSAISTIAAQTATKDANVSLVLAEASDTLTLSAAVPGGEAIVSCPVAAENRTQTEAINLRLAGQTLAKYRSPNSDALQIKVSNRSIQIEQSSANEHRKTLFLAERPTTIFS